MKLKKNEFVIALKDVSQPGHIKMGERKSPSSYRSMDAALSHISRIARNLGLEHYKLGIFNDRGALVS